MEDLDKIKPLIEKADLVVGFNFKFDYHWLRRYNVDVTNKKLYDCQLAQFIIERQQTPYPSLDGCCEKYQLGNKIDVIKENYWKKGIDTDCIPKDILYEYAIKDVLLTLKLYEKQQQLLGSKARLVSLVCQDLHVLADMEWNGLRFDREKSLQQAAEVKNKIADIKSSLFKYHNLSCFNWSSNDHLSCLLFGGTITEDVRIPIGVFKSGKKVGEQRFKVEVRENILPRKFKPSAKNKRSKEGMYFVNEDILLKLGKDHELVKGILEIKKLEKLEGTYLRGFPERQDEMNCNKDYLYGQYNQCVAATGRLSSSKPNLQNMLEDAQRLIISRF